MLQNITNWPSYFQKKLIIPTEMKERIAILKKEGKTIATLNGSFDLLHAGHLHIIYEASLQADVLIVLLNSDSSIRAYKSPLRPIINLEYRLIMMSALGFVSYVSWFNETDPLDCLKLIEPHVHVNGVEYGSECIEASYLASIQARLHLVEKLPGLSTSAIIKTIIGTEGL